MASPTLSPVLMATAAPTPASATSGASAAGTGASSGESFAGLLETPAESSAGTDALSSTESSQVTATAADSETEAVEDAPWPPPGLEGLLGSAATTVPTPEAGIAAIGVGVAGALPAGTGDQPGDIAPDTLTSPLTDRATPALSLTNRPALTPPALQAATAEAGTLAMPPDLVADAAGDILPTTLITSPTGSEAGSGFASLIGLGAPTATGSTATAPSLPEAPATLDLSGAQPEQEIGKNIEWMLDQKLQSARIRISPDHMGSIEVELKLDGSRVHAHFSSAHADVRQVLNDSLPRLREMLDSQGLEMGQTAVASQSSSDAQQQAGRSGTQPSVAGATGEGETVDAPVRRLHLGLLDTYA